MELSGNLKKFPLPKVLQFLNMDQASGELRLIRGKRQMVLLLEEGNIIDVKDNQRPIQQRMSGILQKSGIIGERELTTVMEESKTRLQPLGKVLTDSNFLSTNELHRLLKRVYFEALIEALDLPDGTYEFEHKEGLMPSELPDPISVNSLMLNQARQEDEWAALQKIVPSRDVVFGPSEQRDETSWEKAVSTMSPDEQRIAKSLDGFSTVGMVADMTFSTDFDVANTISDLVRRGLVTRVFEQEAAYASTKPKKFFSINIGPLALRTLYITAALIVTVLIVSKTIVPIVLDWEENRIYLETAGLKQDTANAVRMTRLQSAFYAYLRERGGPPPSLQALIREGFSRPSDITIIGGGRFELKVIGLQENRAVIQGVDSAGQPIESLQAELSVR